MPRNLESNLARARKAAGLSQEELAARLPVSQSQISKWEGDPDEFLPPKWAMKIGAICGCDWASLYSSEDGDNALQVDFGSPYVDFDRSVRLLMEYVDAFPDQTALDEMDPPLARNLTRAMHTFWRKPVVAAMGAFDAGKSTLLNALLGHDILPTYYQPATRLPTFVVHTAHKPSWMRDGESVLIVPHIDINRLYAADASTLREAVLAIGNAQTLAEFGTHRGLYGSNDSAKAAVVFGDAPILRTCVLLDLPGYDESERDAQTADLAVGRTDVVVYASPAVGFMKASDFQRLSHILRAMPSYESSDPSFPTLGNVFLVATHARPGISGQQLDEIAESAAIRCFRDLGDGTIPALVGRSGRAIDESLIRSRIFPFYRESPSRNAALVASIRDLCSSTMPRVWSDLAMKTVEQFRQDGKRRLRGQIDDWSEAIRRFSDMRAKLEEREKQEPDRKRAFAESKTRIMTAVDECQSHTCANLEQYLNERLSLDAITEEITAKYTNKKDAAESYGNYLVDTVQTTIESSCREYGAELASKLEVELTDVLPEFMQGIERPGQLGAFDVKGLFIGAIAGLSTFGALAIWAATCGPLGGYILVAYGTGVLATLGIPIGSAGAAGVVSLVSAIGGPIVLGIGLAILAGMAFWKLFGDSWQRALAKKVVASLQEKQARSRWMQILDTYWTQTRIGIVCGYDALEKQCQKELNELREMVASPAETRRKLETDIARAERIYDFFAGIPWRRPEQ